MIDFRYHLVSIIAIFMALAVGIVLGAGPLKTPIDAAITSNYEALVVDKRELTQEKQALERRGEYRDRAMAALAPSLVGGRLSGRRVVLVTTPTADGKLVTDVTEVLEQAGAAVTGSVAVTDAYGSEEKRTGLEDALDQLTPAGTDLPTAASPYVRAGNVIGRAIVSPQPRGGDTPFEAGVQLLDGLQDVGVLTVEGEPAVRAGLAVMVAGTTPEMAEQTGDATAALGELATGIDRQGGGTVVVGPPDAAAANGVISYIRDTDMAEGQVSTVDAGDTAVGRISAVYALAAQVQGKTAHYGVGPGAEDPFPRLTLAKS